MSNAALTWAWEQEGLTLAERLVLLYLADRYNDEQGLAWPLQSEIVSATTAGLRTVQWCMARLQEKGLVSVTRRGTKNSAPGYHLNIDSQPATIAHRENLNPQSLRSTRNQPAMVAHRENLNPQSTTSQPAMVACQPANDDVEYKEYIPKEPKGTQRETVGFPESSYSPVIQILTGIPGFVFDEGKVNQLTEYLTKKAVSPDTAEKTAISIQAKVVFEKGRWSYQTKNGKQWSSDLCALMKNWSLRPSPPAHSNGHQKAWRPEARTNPEDFKNADDW